MAAYVNRTRKALRLVEPRDLDFPLNLNHIGPDFVQGDLRVDGHRHTTAAAVIVPMQPFVNTNCALYSNLTTTSIAASL